MIAIDKNIPIPAKGRKPHIFPYAEMQIGDSFFHTWKTIYAASASHRTWRLRHNSPFKFKVRAVFENGSKGYRVWRVV